MKKIVAIASGKGGVGKSTIASNLAVALANDANNPQRVALIDTDFYGPSIPTLMGGGDIYPDSDNKIVPPERFGVRYISIAFFLRNADDPVIWRGPMFSKAINQLFEDVQWGEIDIAIVDMPPGTGDAQLSLAQQVELDGVVLVTTPQEVALSDVRRAVNMFRKVNVPVLGLVENMAGFITPDGVRHEIFGSGGGDSLCQQYGLKLFESLPLDISIREGGDKGIPSVMGENPQIVQQFNTIAKRLMEELDVQHKCAGEKLKVVN